MKLTDYLSKYQDENVEERLRELIDEASNLLQSSTIKPVDDWELHRHFTIWNNACWQYLQTNRALFPDIVEYFAHTGIVSPVFKIASVVGEQDPELIARIQTELKERQLKLTNAQTSLPKVDRQIVKIEEHQLFFPNEPKKSFDLNEKESQLLSLLKASQGRPQPMRDLASALGYSKANSRKASNHKRDLNKKFKELIGDEIELIGNVSRKGYLLNTKELTFV